MLKQEQGVNWFKKHADALGVVAAIILSMVWMSGQFRDVDTKISALDSKLTAQINSVDARLTAQINMVEKEVSAIEGRLTAQINSVEKDVAVIKAILCLKNIAPAEAMAKIEKE